MGIDALKPAVFLDRDGVLNPSVLNPAIGKMESPHHPDDFKLFSCVPESLKKLQDAGYALFVVSNQPSYALGKTSLEKIQAIAAKCEAELAQQGVNLTKAYYCYHHPKGIVQGYSGTCECRKPSPFFLKQAAQNYGIDLGQSWMIGDRDTDIACGRDAGARTIFVRSGDARGIEKADCEQDNLEEAVNFILTARSYGRCEYHPAST